MFLKLFDYIEGQKYTSDELILDFLEHVCYQSNSYLGISLSSESMNRILKDEGDKWNTVLEELKSQKETLSYAQIIQVDQLWQQFAFNEVLLVFFILKNIKTRN